MYTTAEIKESSPKEQNNHHNVFKKSGHSHKNDDIPINDIRRTLMKKTRDYHKNEVTLGEKLFRGNVKISYGK
jgi:hypothetical protein